MSRPRRVTYPSSTRRSPSGRCMSPREAMVGRRPELSAFATSSAMAASVTLRVGPVRPVPSGRAAAGRAALIGVTLAPAISAGCAPRLGAAPAERISRSMPRSTSSGLSCSAKPSASPSRSRPRSWMLRVGLAASRGAVVSGPAASAVLSPGAAVSGLSAPLLPFLLRPKVMFMTPPHSCTGTPPDRPAGWRPRAYGRAALKTNTVPGGVARGVAGLIPDTCGFFQD